jgi:hypothetical protein
MMSNDPSLRPSVEEILNLEWFSSLQESSMSDAEIIQKLKLELDQARITIKELQYENEKLKTSASK